MNALRRIVGYRAAVWCVRLGNASGVVWIFAAFGDPFSFVGSLPWFVGALLGVSALVLLRLDGERDITRDGWKPD